jgi:hypothetical protein
VPADGVLLIVHAAVPCPRAHVDYRTIPSVPKD